MELNNAKTVNTYARLIRMQRNTVLFKFYYFFWRFKPLAALMMIYFSQVMHSYATATAVFAIFNISYSLAKIPSGLLSDKIGRKPIIIAANICLTAAFCLSALSGQFEIKWLLYLFALLWGCGEALSAGTVEALMFETAQSLKSADKFYLIYSKSMYYDQLGCAFGAFCAMAITYFLPLQFVAWLSIFPPCMQLIVSCLFTEPDVRKKRIAFSVCDLSLALRQFKHNRILFFYTLADIFFSTLGDVSHRLESAYFKTFTGEWVISLARMLKHICGMAGFAFMMHLRAFTKVQIFFGSIISNIFVRSIALAFNNICTPFIHMFINFFYATASTAKTDILQHEFLPEYRASAQAVIQFSKGIYMSIIMLLLGIFADTYGIYSAMMLLVIIRLCGLLGAYFLHRRLNIKLPITI